MIRKFIVTKDKIFFGGEITAHQDIANMKGLPKKDVLGGGSADMTKKKIFGMSHQFGKYPKEIVQKLLPRWTVE